MLSEMVITHPMKRSTGSSFAIHQRNLQFLATEMFRVYTGSAPDFLDEVVLLNPESL